MGCLVGKVSLVTGGARGSGAAIIRRLAAEGAHVAFAYRGAEEAADALVAKVNEAGGQVFAILADDSDRGQIEAMFAARDATFGAAPSLGILVNNAKITPMGRMGQPATSLGLAI